MITKELFSANKIFVKSILFLLAIAFSTTNVFAKGPSHNNDPLSLDEVKKTMSMMSGSKLSARTIGDVESPVVKNPQEILLIEKNREKGAPSDQRRADVFVYDYSTDELIQSLVDLNTSEVLRSERKQGVQLPLTKNELKRVKEIVFEDEEELAILEHEYRRITSRELTDAAELNVKAFTFLAESLPNRVNEASKECGIHRCAQLMLYTQENVVFEVSPIVNLSKSVVTQRIGF